ncbi:hypothetical protein [Polaribacter sp. 20A6]|uniref:hypothetical protein n=1 Tax=Polaribacter sp. 20A6 TaxID=2687289 RepID=UPI0013FD7A9B|nr:hypothetical protein [Polaribacter sp. 20A6]
MDELKFFILKEILKNEDKNLNDSDFFKLIEHKVGWTEYHAFLSDFIRNNLVDEYSANKLTELGKNRLNELKIQIDQKSKDEIAERTKLHNESILSGWKRKTFWYIFIFGIFGGIYSGIDLFKKITQEKEIKTEPINKEQLEVELSKLRTLILTKNNDSLNNDNSKTKH